MLYEQFAADRHRDLVAAADRHRMGRAARPRVLHPRLGRSFVDAGLRLIRLGVRLAEGGDAARADLPRALEPAMLRGGRAGHVGRES